jgi:glycosyltransferase involved in cell wall biosynthesis
MTATATAGVRSEPAARPLRVLQVVQRFYPELGGLETHVAEVTRRIQGSDDIEVTILATDRSGELPAEDEVAGVRVLRRRSWPRDGEAYLSPGIAKVIAEGGWDLVHVQGSQTTVPTTAMLAALRAGVPYVVTFHSGGHSSPLHSVITAVQNTINRPLLRRARALIAVSRFERARFSRLLGLREDRFHVIPNGGALPLAAAAVRPIPGRIVTSGRLERYKGHHRVIEALPLIRREIPDATLTVLGSGPYDGELRRIADEQGVADAVAFEHLLPAQRSEMAAILGRSSVMTALSSYEAHPVAVMEAVALGLPVVGLDVAGIADLVEDGLVTGVPVSAGPAEVAAAVVTALRAGDGEPHRSPDVELPTWERSAASLLDVYRDVATSDERPLVLQVITTLTTGGAERQVESIVRHSRFRHRVVALYGGGPVAESLTAAGYDVDVLDLAGWRRLLALPVLVRLIRRVRPDAVQVHLLSGQLWGLPAARIAGVRTVISTEHSLMDDSIENRPLTPALRSLYLALTRLASVVVAVSTTTARRLERWGVPAHRIRVVDNGIEFDALAADRRRRRAVRSELGIPENLEVIGAVGRLEVVKRFPAMLDALAPTLDPARRVLLVAGDGPLRHPLEEQARRLGVEDGVHFLGRRSDVGDILSATDVLVSTSRDETFGMAVIEGIAAGLPVVFEECPALDGLLEERPGVIRIGESPGVPEASALREAVDAALGSAAGERLPVPDEVRAAYDITETTKRLDDLVTDELVRRRRRR